MNPTRGYRGLWVVLIPLLVACGLAADPAAEVSSPVCASGQIDGEVVLLSRADQLPPEVIDRFERRYGVDVIELLYETDDDLLSRITAGENPFDLVLLGEDSAAILWRAGRLFRLDPIALPGRINLDTRLLPPTGDAEGFFSVPLAWGTVGIGMNRNVVAEDADPTWGLVFDLDQAWVYAGRVSVLSEPRQVMAAAMLFLGFSPNSADRDEVRQAGRLVQEASAHLSGFDSESYATRLVDGGLDLAHGRSDAFQAAFPPDSKDFAYVVPAEGAPIWLESMVIPITSQHPCSAHAFIDFLLEPRTGALVAEHTGKATTNNESLSYLAPETAANRALYPDTETRRRLEILSHTEDLDMLYAEEFALATS